MSNLLDLKDKTAAVIGASSGIGRAVGAQFRYCWRNTVPMLFCVPAVPTNWKKPPP